MRKGHQDIKTIFKKAFWASAKTALCLGLFMGLSITEAFAKNTIKDVRTGQQTDGIRIVLDGTEDFDYDAFRFKNCNYQPDFSQKIGQKSQYIRADIGSIARTGVN